MGQARLRQSNSGEPRNLVTILPTFIGMAPPHASAVVGPPRSSSQRRNYKKISIALDWHQMPSETDSFAFQTPAGWSKRSVDA